MKAIVPMIMMLALLGCRSTSPLPCSRVADLQEQRDALVINVATLYQLKGESIEVVLPRILRDRKASPTWQEWRDNRAVLSEDNLTREVLWLQRFIDEVR
jgi:hypothetical protein